MKGWISWAGLWSSEWGEESSWKPWVWEQCEPSVFWHQEKTWLTAVCFPPCRRIPLFWTGRSCSTPHASPIPPETSTSMTAWSATSSACAKMGLCSVCWWSSPTQAARHLTTPAQRLTETEPPRYSRHHTTSRCWLLTFINSSWLEHRCYSTVHLHNQWWSPLPSKSPWFMMPVFRIYFLDKCHHYLRLVWRKKEASGCCSSSYYYRCQNLTGRSPSLTFLMIKPK